MPPLLITAAFDVGETPHVKLRDTRQRVLHHMEGLLAWLESADFCQIVFAKNCGTKIQERVLCETAAAFGKELEFLQIPSSKLTARQGKGFGEGEIVGGALERSGLPMSRPHAPSPPGAMVFYRRPAAMLGGYPILCLRAGFLLGQVIAIASKGAGSSGLLAGGGIL